MILMPADREQQFTEEHLTDLDRSMQTILKRHIPDEEKATLYLQALQKFVKFPDVNSMVPPQDPEQPKEDFETELLKSAPVKYKNIVSKILPFLKEHPDTISWNASSELLLKGTAIPGTNVKTLINFLLRNQKTKPKGFDEFKQVLEDIHFPEDFVKNKYLSIMYAKPRRPVKRYSSGWLKY